MPAPINVISLVSVWFYPASLMLNAKIQPTQSLLESNEQMRWNSSKDRRDEDYIHPESKFPLNLPTFLPLVRWNDSIIVLVNGTTYQILNLIIFVGRNAFVWPSYVNTRGTYSEDSPHTVQTVPVSRETTPRLLLSF
jgi:hypothetical protein